MSVPPTLQTTQDFNLDKAAKLLKHHEPLTQATSINSTVSLTLPNLKIRILNIITLEKLTINLIDFLTTQRQSNILVSLIYIHKQLLSLLAQLNYYKSILITTTQTHTSSLSSLSFLKVIESQFQAFLADNYNNELNLKILPFYKDLKTNLAFFGMNQGYNTIIQRVLSLNLVIFNLSGITQKEEEQSYRALVDLNASIAFVSDSYQNYKSILQEEKNLNDDSSVDVVNHEDLSKFLERSLLNSKLIEDIKQAEAETDVKEIESQDNEEKDKTLSISNKDITMINSYEFQKFDALRKQNLQINERKVFN